MNLEVSTNRCVLCLDWFKDYIGSCSTVNCPLKGFPVLDNDISINGFVLFAEMWVNVYQTLCAQGTQVESLYSLYQRSSGELIAVWWDPINWSRDIAQEIKTRGLRPNV